MSDLYSTLPTKIYTLEEFVATAHEIQNVNEDAFIDFAITGRNMVAQPSHQVVIDPLRGAGLRQSDNILVFEDFDSVLGIDDRIVVDTDIAVYPVSNPADSLSTSIHMTFPILKGNVSSLDDVCTHRN
jgi:hypothetical protein